MPDETREQIRERLLGDEGIRSIISLRAYEIYQQGDSEPGGELADWLRAENEILAVMIEEELQSSVRQSDAPDSQAETPSSGEEENPEDSPSS